MVANWQTSITKELGLTGRIRLAKEGINGTLCGTKNDLQEYRKRMQESKLFRDIQYKYSISPNNQDPFKNEFQLKMCDEVTSTGPMKDALPTALGGNGGIHLKPADFHEIIIQSKSDPNIIVIDTRNHYETAVGAFENAVDPKIRCFAQFPVWVDANIEKMRGKKIAMYCTGGVRCEKASAYVKNLNVASEVYQLEGGIHSYLEAFSKDANSSGIRTEIGEYEEKEASSGDESECLFRGINFQFNTVLAGELAGKGTDVSKYAPAKCISCCAPWSTLCEGIQCSVCKDLVLICNRCVDNYSRTDPNHFWKSENNVVSSSEMKRPILCFEHQLLADNYEEFLSKLALDLKTLNASIENLKKLLDYAQHQPRRHPRRIRLLKTQYERLLQWRDKSFDRVEACEDNKLDSFVSFVPALNW